MPRRLRFAAATMNCVSPWHQGQWVRSDTRQLEYNNLETWVELARLLERGRFDVLFLADVLGIRDSFPGLRGACLREANQVPVNDPSPLIPVMAYATEHLGFAVTSSVMQAHPYVFARHMSTLDHLTNGRVSWNIVTSFLESAARALGYGQLPPSEERYAQAEEYLQVVYKLLEGSWEDDAVVCDWERGIYAEPGKVHDIDHVGRAYTVVGPHLSEPSPQRVPFLFQAGASEHGREFASRNAEAMFLNPPTPEAARLLIDDVRAHAVANGREPGDILFFQGMSFVIGGTEEEAQRKQREIDEFSSEESYMATSAGSMGIDLSKYPPETPISELGKITSLGKWQSLIDSDPGKGWTLGDLLRNTIGGLRIVGTPEQVADHIQDWADAGVDGFNIYFYTTPGSFQDFVEGVTPVLQERGLQQREYAPGTLREKLTDAKSGPRLNSRHPAAAYRRAWDVSLSPASEGMPHPNRSVQVPHSP